MVLIQGLADTLAALKNEGIGGLFLDDRIDCKTNVGGAVVYRKIIKGQGSKGIQFFCISRRHYWRYSFHDGGHQFFDRVSDLKSLADGKTTISQAIPGHQLANSTIVTLGNGG